MGESDEDIIDLALTLRAMDIDSIPVNFLNSIPTTPFEDKTRAHAAALLENSLPFPFRQSEQRNPRRRRPGSQPALAAAAEPLSGELDVRQRLPDHARTRSLRCPPNDLGSRLRARFAGGDLSSASERQSIQTSLQGDLSCRYFALLVALLVASPRCRRFLRCARSASPACGR